MILEHCCKIVKDHRLVDEMLFRDITAALTAIYANNILDFEWSIDSDTKDWGFHYEPSPQKFFLEKSTKKLKSDSLNYIIRLLRRLNTTQKGRFDFAHFQEALRPLISNNELFLRFGFEFGQYRISRVKCHIIPALWGTADKTKGSRFVVLDKTLKMLRQILGFPVHTFDRLVTANLNALALDIDHKGNLAIKTYDYFSAWCLPPQTKENMFRQATDLIEHISGIRDIDILTRIYLKGGQHSIKRLEKIYLYPKPRISGPALSKIAKGTKVYRQMHKTYRRAGVWPAHTSIYAISFFQKWRDRFIPSMKQSMIKADIKVGFSCNNMCDFCAQGSRRYQYSDRSTEEAKQILESCRKQNIGSVVFTGGEPTIRSDITEIISYAKKLGICNIQIQSNGRLFCYDDFCEDLIGAGATEFCLALHGSNSRMHDSLTNSPGSFKQTVQGIENLVRRKQSVLMNTVITSENFKALPKIAQLFVQLGVKQFQFAFVHIIGSAAKNAKWIVPKKSQVMPFVAKGLKIGACSGVRVLTEAIPFCFMRGLEQHIAENIIPLTKVFDRDQIIENFTAIRKQEGKIKAGPCNVCRVKEICEGPWKEYVKLYGWAEFKAIKNTERECCVGF